jgi:hypothetical protein
MRFGFNELSLKEVVAPTANVFPKSIFTAPLSVMQVLPKLTTRPLHPSGKQGRICNPAQAGFGFVIQ